MTDPTFDVYPSLIVVHAKEGDFNVDIGWLYAMMAASIRQNGIWGDMDFESLSGEVRDRFKFNSEWLPSGSITGIRFTRKRY